MKSLLLFLISVFSQIGIAGTISLQSNVQLTQPNSFKELVQSLRVDVQIKIKNLGTEAAHSVRPDLATVNSAEVEDLNLLKTQNISPQEEVSWSFVLRLKDPSAELKLSQFSSLRWVIPFLVKYQDVNGYQFSIPIHGILLSGDESASQKSKDSQRLANLLVSHEIEPESENDYAIRLKIQNQAPRSRKLKAELIHPMEIENQSVMPPIEVSAQGDAYFTFNLKNKTALMGSKYNLIFILTEEVWRAGKLHLESQVETIFLHIKKDSPKIEWKLELILEILFIIYVVCGIVLLYRKSKPRRSGNTPVDSRRRPHEKK